MDLGLKGKVAVVVGAGSGIGSAISRQLAAEGVVVIAADIQVETAAALVAEIRAEGGDAREFAVDVRQAFSVEKFAKFALDECRLRPAASNRSAGE